MQYKKPNLVNTNLGGNLIDKGDLYVYATFMKCGKQYYAIESYKPERQIYVHSCIPKFRNEEIPKFLKEQNKRHQVQRNFIKESSVFQNWKRDDNLILH